MARHDIHPLNGYTMILRECSYNFPFFPFIFSGDNDDWVSSMNFHK